MFGSCHYRCAFCRISSESVEIIGFFNKSELRMTFSGSKQHVETVFWLIV